MKTRIFLLLFVLPVIARSQIGFIHTVAGNGGASMTGDGGLATAASIGANAGIAFDRYGNYYFTAYGNKVRKVAVSGIITTVAGTGTAGYSGDGGLATGALVNGPYFVGFDNSNNIYITESYNHRIRKVNATTGIITTFVGTGTAGYGGDGGQATSAQINSPSGVCFDKSGNLYFSDYFNNRIRKVDTFGVITTYAGTGTGGYSGDGGLATAADIFHVFGICIDTSGNVYTCDGARVRKIDALTGIISTYAGSGLSTTGGDGGPATAAGINPQSLVMSPTGELYICEQGNNDVRKVDASGIISTVAGAGGTGFSGDGGPATAATLWVPRGVALDACGNLFICDNSNFRIRKVAMPPILTTPTISLSGSTSYPVGGTVSITAAVGSAGSSYLIHWLNNGIEFTTTTVPTVVYTKGPGIDTITARIVPTGYGCWDSTTSSNHIIFTNTTGVGNITGSSVVVYPNPAHSTLTIAKAAPGSEATITNMVGQQLLRQPLSAKETTIDIAHLPAGVYIIKVAGEGVQMITRIVKE